METTGNIHDLESALVDIVKYIDPKLKWLAKDGDGEYCLHEHKPILSKSFANPKENIHWTNEGNEFIMQLILPYGGDWKESLINLEEVRGNE
tara:strand:+ start:28671 stop:28946 length:276 start_codon:yes stop_codon:yes gene_type:complete